MVALFEGAFDGWRFKHGDCPAFAHNPEQLAALFIDKYGPLQRNFSSLAPGKAGAMRQDIVDTFRGYVTPADGKVRFGREYLVAVATRA